MSYTPGSASKAAEFNQFYYDGYRTWSTFYSEAYKDVRAYAGDNWTIQERNFLRQQRRSCLELNRIRRMINMFSGYERENRKSIVVGPVEGSDEQTSDQLSDVMIQVYDKASAYHVFSDAFEHMLKSGLAIIGIYIDYNRDKVNGDIKFYWKPFNAIILDPYFTKRDLSDCDAAGTRDLLSKQMVKSMLPWISPKEIDDIPCGIRDNKFQYLGIWRQYNSTYIEKNLVTYDQYWKVINKPVKLLVDLETGESREINFKREDMDNLNALIAGGENMQIIDSHKRSVELSIIVGGVELYTGPDPTGLDDFPFKPLIGYWEPLIDSYELKVQGVVRQMRDSQRLYNKKWSSLTDYSESILNTGYIVKNGAVVDPNMLYQTGQGKVITLNDSFGMDAIQPLRPADMPPTAFQYNEALERNLIEGPGGSDEMMGISSSGDAQISGQLAMTRASNGLKGNRALFDNYEETLKQVGLLTLRGIQINYSAGKIQRMINQEPTEEIKSAAFAEYDCVIKQAVLTQTQREAYYYELLRLRELGLAIPDDEILEAAPLQGKNKLKERMQQQAEQQQQQQQQQAEDKHRQDQLTESQTQENLALAQARRADVLSKIALSEERVSEAAENRAQAALARAKTINEVSNMETDRLLKVMNFVNMLEQQERADQESVSQKVFVKADAINSETAGSAENQMMQQQQMPQGGPNG